MSVNLAVFSHAPSQAMKDWLKTLGGTWVTHHYYHRTTQVKDLEKGIHGLLMNMVEDLRGQGYEIDQMSRVLVVPPAMSLAGMPFMEGMRGLFGRYPEVIRTMPDPSGSGEYIACPEAPFVNYTYLFDRLRKERPKSTTPRTAVVS